MAEVRVLIDFATGDNWEMPSHLYNDYERVCKDLEKILPSGLTCIQYWLSLLPEEQRKMVVRKKN